MLQRLRQYLFFFSDNESLQNTTPSMPFMNYPSDTTCVLKKDSTEKIFQNKLYEDLLYDVEDNELERLRRSVV